MSTPVPPQPVKLIVSILTGETDLVPAVCEQLAARFGAADFISAALPFHFTDYYEQEMGAGLFRHLVSFGRLIDPGALPSIKLFTNELEEQCRRGDGTRRVNIDPGYVSLFHLILATCKPFTHRPYLCDGVYADMTLVFRHKTFRPLEWTFPDYGSDRLISILNDIRAAYHRQLLPMHP